MSERHDNTASAESAPRWTIDELGAQVALALSVDYAGQSNGQVSDVPNRRTIRYYTTLGLLDRPSSMRGRTALYDRRHLKQLVAIKRLQAQGLSLAEVQERLAAVSDATLSRLADLPAVEAATARAEAPESPRSGDFWQAGPAQVSEADEPVDENVDDSLRARGPSAPALTPSAAALQGIELAPGVILLVESSRGLSRLDVDAIETAAAPLLSVLRARGLPQASPNGEQP